MGIMTVLLLVYMKVFKLDKLTWPGNFRSYLFSLFGFTESCCFKVFTRSIVQSLGNPRWRREHHKFAYFTIKNSGFPSFEGDIGVY